MKKSPFSLILSVLVLSVFGGADAGAEEALTSAGPGVGSGFVVSADSDPASFLEEAYYQDCSINHERIERLCSRQNGQLIPAGNLLCCRY